MVVGRVRVGAAGAVNGGVVDAGEADRLGGVADETDGGWVAGRRTVTVPTHRQQGWACAGCSARAD